MRLRFVAPNPEKFISGGNTYNRLLISALEQEGIEVVLTDELNDDFEGFTLIDSIEFSGFNPNQIPANSISLIHHLPSLYPGPDILFEKDEKPVLDSFDYHIVTSHFMNEFMVSKGYPAAQILCLEPVADYIDRQDDNITSKVNAIMLNNIIPRKGVLDFLVKLAALNLQPAYRLIIVGDLQSDEEYSSKCTELVRGDRNLSRTVRFVGAQDDPTVRRLMMRSNLFISASHFETFGMSIQEASEIGLPLLVLYGGNTARHVNEGTNGYSCQSHSELATRFEQFIEQPKQFLQIQRSAKAYHHNYARSWIDHANDIKRVIHQ